ncbi:solute carrier family 12 member 8-like [Sycon ciliatum]|uniref:solute carrier family 12 member 8-like n=1 Tax=Sycon ciliatum TaxID=27933 RepID=UPI0031F680B1
MTGTASSAKSMGYQQFEGMGDERELWEETTDGEHRNRKPWWKANFFVKEPLLFGTWDGVFTTCMLNIFGVIVFLRVGWMVGYAGVGLASLIIFLSLFVGFAVTISVIGLVRQLPMEGARCDIFHVVAYVLGRRTGGVVGLLFVFGQAVAVAMYSIGLGEAMADVFNLEGTWPVRGIALGTTTLLLLIVLAGVQWVIKLQLLLLMILALAVLDFIIGSFTHVNLAAGFVGYSSGLMSNNTPPSFGNIDDGKDASEDFFTVFAVFFPTIVGVASGINMARDIRRPERSVPIGTFAALVVSGVLYLLFALILAATCQRDSLRDDPLMAYRVSLVGWLFLFGLYVSSLSACLGAIYAAPRVFQSIASEKIIPLLSVMSQGSGPNNEPVLATITVALVSYIFIFIGHLNTLAVIVNMPFLLTYGALDYAYFSQAMSRPPDFSSQLYDGPLGADSSNGAAASKQAATNGADDAGHDENTAASESAKIQMSVHADPKGAASATKAHAYGAVRRHLEEEVLGTLEPSVQQERTRKRRRFDALRRMRMPSQLTKVKQCLAVSPERQERWADATVAGLNKITNKYVALVGFISSLFIMFLMQWAFALGTVTISLLLYIYIGHVNPGLPPGHADFSFRGWIMSMVKPGQYRPMDGERVLVPDVDKIEFDIHQQTQSGRDFAHRQPWHRSVAKDNEAANNLMYGSSSGSIIAATAGSQPFGTSAGAAPYSAYDRDVFAIVQEDGNGDGDQLTAAASGSTIGSSSPAAATSPGKQGGDATGVPNVHYQMASNLSSPVDGESGNNGDDDMQDSDHASGSATF